MEKENHSKITVTKWDFFFSSESKANPFTIICAGFGTAKIYWGNLEFLRKDKIRFHRELSRGVHSD